MGKIKNKSENKDKDKTSTEVDHPQHYRCGKFECIDVIEDLHLGFNLGNVFKYIWRAGRKADTKLLQDLKKAAWYLQREIGNLEKDIENDLTSHRG